MRRSGATSYIRAERIVGHQDGHPHLRFAPAAGPRPPANQVPPGPGPAPLALPQGPGLLGQHLQGPSDITESGGTPRRATAWETEARSVADSLARIVNTEGPGP
jgi:hypothetical protein